MKTISITHWVKRHRPPKICILCTQYFHGTDAVCSACHEFLIPNRYACTCCALPLPASQFLTCGICIQKKPYFDNTFAPYLFEEPLRTLLHEFKYHQGLYLTSFLANLILNNLPASARNTECLIPVPLHTHRLSKRGFNQAGELSKYMSNRLGIPYSLSHCEKKIHTEPQAGLNGHQRRRNLHNAFRTKRIDYKHITLIDDLLTTGSTTNELAKTFKTQGVETVDVWCCARVVDMLHKNK